MPDYFARYIFRVSSLVSPMDKPARCDLRHNGLPKATTLKNRTGNPNQVTTFADTQFLPQANLAEGASGTGVDNSGYPN